MTELELFKENNCDFPENGAVKLFQFLLQMKPPILRDNAVLSDFLCLFFSLRFSTSTPWHTFKGKEAGFLCKKKPKKIPEFYASPKLMSTIKVLFNFAKKNSILQNFWLPLSTTISFNISLKDFLWTLKKRKLCWFTIPATLKDVLSSTVSKEEKQVE